MSLRPVYSVNLFESAGVHNLDAIGPVTGAIIVIRDIEVVEQTGTVGALLVLNNSAGGAAAVFQRTSGTATGWESWSGRMVISQGLTFWWTVGTGTWAATVSGYELPTP